jgi:hypothetical protein
VNLASACACVAAVQLESWSQLRLCLLIVLGTVSACGFLEFRAGCVVQQAILGHAAARSSVRTHVDWALVSCCKTQCAHHTMLLMCFRSTPAHAACMLPRPISHRFLFRCLSSVTFVPVGLAPNDDTAGSRCKGPVLT